jgi:hypothetical protein
MTAAPPETPQSPPPPTAPTKPESRGRRVAIGVGILLAVVGVYALSLVGVHLLAKSSPPLPEVDLSQFQKDDTVVKLRVEELKPVANRLIVNVLVYPAYSIYDEKFGVLTTDAAVRLYPDNDLGDLQYAKRKAPARKSPPRSRRTAIPVTGHSTPTGPTKSQPWSSPGIITTYCGAVWK